MIPQQRSDAGTAARVTSADATAVELPSAVGVHVGVGSCPSPLVPAMTPRALTLLVPLALWLVPMPLTDGTRGPGGTAQAAPEPSPALVALVRPLHVTIEVPVPEAGFRFELETVGLVVGLLEQHLADLDGVVPLTAGGRRPGMARSLDGPAFTASVRLFGRADELEVVLELVDAEGTATRLAASASRDTVELAAAQVALQAAAVLGRAPTVPSEPWGRAVSDDAYARLLAGRAVAHRLGLLHAPDAATEACGVDPGLALAWRERGRVALAAGRADEAQRALQAAAAQGPGSAADAADAAAALVSSGRTHEGQAAWHLVASERPGDGRFLVPAATAALTVGRPEVAASLLASLGDEANDAAVARLRVDVAEALGPGPGYDLLVAAWRRADGDDPEPVRRLLRVYAERGELHEALRLVEELEARGEADLARSWELALAAHAGDWARAASVAREAGLVVTADRLAALAATHDPTVEVGVSWVSSGDPLARLVRAEVALARADPAEALELARPVLEAHPWMPEALDLRARALEALGRSREAEATRRALLTADPAWGTAPG